jgi:hypothetical protein
MSSMSHEPSPRKWSKPVGLLIGKGKPQQGRASPWCEQIVRADQQHKTVTHGASKGRAIWVDVIMDDLHIQVKC